MQDKIGNMKDNEALSTAFGAHSALGVRIIIEGADGVGKDTFIRNFVAYINGTAIADDKGNTLVPAMQAFEGKNFVQLNSPHSVRKGGNGRKGKIAGEIIYQDYASQKQLDEIKRHPKRFHHGFSIPTPKWGNILSNITVHPSQTTVQSRDFIAKLNAGEITDQNYIAEEYLQVHWDLENHCKELDQAYDLVIMNRSLVSYYAMQINAMGFEQHRTNWGKLWNYSKQKSGIFVHLTLDEQKLQARLAARQEHDFRGEVENTYMQKFKAINEGFEQIKQEDTWLKVFTVDTGVDVKEYASVYEDILQFIHTHYYQRNL